MVHFYETAHVQTLHNFSICDELADRGEGTKILFTTLKNHLKTKQIN